MSEPDVPPLLGRAFRRETTDDPSMEQMVRILDFQDTAPSIRRLRQWSFAQAGVTPGERAVDIGSGTGTITRALATLVGPAGRVTGVDPNPMMRAVAASRTDAPNVTYVDGAADTVPLEDAGTDLVWCERVLQHVADAAGALREVARVLRPGGRALVLDSDHASRVNSDIDPEVEHAITLAFMGQMANPMAARHVPRQAIAAGLTVEPDVGSAALLFPQDLLLEAPLLRMAADQAVRDGTISAEQADAAVEAQHEAARRGWAFSAVTVFAFVLRKPE